AIKETPAANFYEGLGNLKEVDLMSASLGFKVINTRGFNSSSPVRSLQIIDGVDNQSPGLNFSLGNFLGASELDIEQVDLIIGASSAYYGPNAFNGVISMNTKSPFVHKGVSAQVKLAERNMVEGAVRVAKAFKNKAGKDKFAFKLNLYYLRADDWEAGNADESYRDTARFSNYPYVGVDDPGRYDAVNRYGDERTRPGQNNATSFSEQITTPGLNYYHRTGYWERDVLDYDTRNFKSSLALHYMLTDKVELIGASAFSAGTTVYQGDNRYSLKDILFFQHRIEVRQKDKFFLRAYMTHEDAGNSYDAVFTAFELQESQKNDLEWARDYRNAYQNSPQRGGFSIPDSVKALEGFPGLPTFPDFSYNFAQADSVLARNNDRLTGWHSLARGVADNRYLEPGTPEFQALFDDITSRPIGQGGTRLVDRSALYHVHGEYKFSPSWANITTGANARLYTPVSDGTIFLDTGDVRITNFEFGAYGGIDRTFDKVKASATVRLDKNQNFRFLFSPALSLIWNINEDHLLRGSASWAIRNPTLADQYLFYNVGRAILLGNITGIDSLITLESFEDFTNSLNRDTLDYFNVPRIRPERVRTFELGYRGKIKDRFFVDASYYFSRYTDFIGFRLGLDAFFSGNLVTFAQGYRVSANAADIVTTQGASIGLNYYFENGLSINGNYSWNRLNTQTDDPIIPAFNTPEHKFNIGFAGRDMTIAGIEHIGFNINYKWIEGFLFEGSPQFTGFIDSYDQVDVQVNKRFPDLKTTFKVGASNALNNQVYQIYGGPLVGRLIYCSATFELDRLKN
ncbi:MAG: TonB-dependent receptor, partial [Bacteroidota bacterium]